MKLTAAALAVLLFSSPGHSEIVVTKGLNASIVRLDDISKTTNLSLSKTTLTFPKVQLSSSRTYSPTVKSATTTSAASSSTNSQQNKKKSVKSSKRKPLTQPIF